MSVGSCSAIACRPATNMASGTGSDGSRGGIAAAWSHMLGLLPDRTLVRSLCPQYVDGKHEIPYAQGTFLLSTVPRQDLDPAAKVVYPKPRERLPVRSCSEPGQVRAR